MMPKFAMKRINVGAVELIGIRERAPLKKGCQPDITVFD
jgi:hypothetical protein